MLPTPCARSLSWLVAAATLTACSAPPSSAREFDAGVRADAATVLGCDPLACTCGDDDGCYWFMPGDFECAPSLKLPRYHVCAASTQCSPGDGCHLDDFVNFYCTGYCDYATYAGERDPGRCSDHELCASFDGDVGICLGICDPLDSTCPPDQGCYVIPNAADLCIPSGQKRIPGEECRRNPDCAPGAGCVGSDDDMYCATYCDHDTYPEASDPRCNEGEICVALAFGERIGVCATAL